MCPEMPHENALTAARATRLASGGALAGVGPEGEFHESAESASDAHLAGVTPTREIHL